MPRRLVIEDQVKLRRNLHPKGYGYSMGIQSRLVATRAPRSVIIIRLMVGAVFLSEGLQKFMFPDAVGAGRFARIGLPAPEHCR